MPTADRTSFKTFRDPAGSVEIRSDAVYRAVRKPYSADFEEFLRTPLADELFASGKLVGCEVLSSDADGLQLRHPRVPFPSYPWEWPAGMWLESGQLTLEICKTLLKSGWVLKDATPLNILFNGSKPLLVDVLSIEKSRSGETIWQAYGQFIRTFVLPLLAHSQLGWPLQAFQIRRDGFEPEEIFRALGWSQRLLAPARAAVTVPVLLKKLGGSGISHGSTKGEIVSKTMDPEIATEILCRRLDGLRANLRKSLPHARESVWKRYAETATHYSEEDHARKKQFVERALQSVCPQTVLDVGCNTGTYSRLAAEIGAQVVSIDSDMQALERLYAEAKEKTQPILPLCVDLAYPTAAFGWENRETSSFLERSKDYFDAVLMLAVIHHLLLSSQIPLQQIADLVSRITKKALVLEWVPPTDPKFIEVLRGRAEIYRHITEEALRDAFSKHFAIVSEVRLRNARLLLHMKKR